MSMTQIMAMFYFKTSGFRCTVNFDIPNLHLPRLEDFKMQGMGKTDEFSCGRGE